MEMADQLGPIFTEVVIAPSYEPGVLERLGQEEGPAGARRRAAPGGAGRRAAADRRAGCCCRPPTASTRPVTTRRHGPWPAARPADEKTLADLVFGWRALRAVKSNAILLARDGATVGVGMGQVNRVDSCRLAVARAGDRVAGSVAASDAFFPFPDGPQVLLEAGVSVIVQPGGSIRDDAVIEAVKAAGATMYFTGTRHFAH